MKLYCDTTRAYPETKLVDPEHYSCNIPSIDGTTETSSEIILTEGYNFPKDRKSKASNPGTSGLEPEKNERQTTNNNGFSTETRKGNF